MRLVALQHVGSSQTRNQTRVPCIGRRILNYWSTSCCCSAVQLCPTLCDPVECSTPGFPVLHSFPEGVQTHIRRVGDAIQPSRPLLPPSPPQSFPKVSNVLLEKSRTSGKPSSLSSFFNKYPWVADLSVGCRHGWVSGVGSLLPLCPRRLMG